VIGLDTNVLLRYLLRDDPRQSPKGAQALEHLTKSSPGFVSLVTVVEISWVLDTVYGFAPQEIARAIEYLLQAESLFLQNEQEVSAAVQALKSGQGSFDDALIGALGSWAGCTATLTFDKRASRLQGFELIA